MNQKLHDQMLDALCIALPFVEDQEGCELYKPSAVRNAVSTIMAAIKAAQKGPKMIELERKDLYAYGLGYFYGRSEGHDPGFFSDHEETAKHYFSQGYESGVADYCRDDINEEIKNA